MVSKTFCFSLYHTTRAHGLFLLFWFSVQLGAQLLTDHDDTVLLYEAAVISHRYGKCTDILNGQQNRPNVTVPSINTISKDKKKKKKKSSGRQHVQ